MQSKLIKSARHQDKEFHLWEQKWDKIKEGNEKLGKKIFKRVDIHKI